MKRRFYSGRRSYRLHTPSNARVVVRSNEVERLVRSGVEEIHQSVLFALRLLRQAMDLHTAVLLWKDDAETHLRVSEVSSADPKVVEGPFLVGDGIFGAVTTQRSTNSTHEVRVVRGAKEPSLVSESFRKNTGLVSKRKRQERDA